MAHSNVNLAALIGSRICHDLISPIGAITNGLELLDMTGAPSGPEMELISDSVGDADARIRFFRIAYGAAGDQMMGRPEILSVLEGLSHSGRVRFVWEPTEAQTREDVRLVFLALQCCETALAHGGAATVRRDGADWTVTGSGRTVNIDAGLWQGMADRAAARDSGGDGIRPATVQFALLPELLRNAGRALRLTSDESAVVLRF